MSAGMIDHLAEQVGETAKALREVAENLREVGLPEDARLVESHAKRLTRLAHDFLASTQPIEIPKEAFKARINQLTAALQEVAADLITSRRRGASAEIAGVCRSLIEAASRLDD